MINKVLYAGDTITWTESDSNYPASGGWTIKYILINSSAKISLTSTASGNDHVFTIPKTTSDDWSAGKYQFTRFVEDSTTSYTLNKGIVEIKKDVRATSITTFDYRSHARKVLDAIESVLENRATKDQEAYSIAGRSLSRTPIAELLKLRTQYWHEVVNELKNEKIDQGKSPGGRVLLKFK